jgi:heme/copper-type cytochrome/quinol oxidase subunit 1
MVVIGLFGIVGVGGWVFDPAATGQVVFIGMGLAAVLPPLALLGLLGDTARSGTPKLRAPLVLALGSALMLLAGAAAGAVEAIKPLKLAGTTWEPGQIHLLLMGGGALAAFAALWFWAPKIWGAHLAEAAGFLVALLVLGGAVLLAVPDLVSGAAEKQPRGALEFADSTTIKTSNAVSMAGGALSALGVIVALGAVAAASRRRSVPAVDDPWGGWTLEWTTTSPPPAYNFEAIPELGARTS